MTPPFRCILVGSGPEALVIQLSPPLIIMIQRTVVFELISVVHVRATPKVYQLGLAVAHHKNPVLL
jgi:hypothetical protein